MNAFSLFLFSFWYKLLISNGFINTLFRRINQRQYTDPDSRQSEYAQELNLKEVMNTEIYIFKYIEFKY